MKDKRRLDNDKWVLHRPTLEPVLTGVRQRMSLAGAAVITIAVAIIKVQVIVGVQQP
jgi:hypothetical protein